MAARNADRLSKAAAQVRQNTGTEALAIVCDVSKREDVENLVSQTIARFGRVDVLVNNAGYGMIAPFESVKIEDATAMFATNFFGAVHCVQSVLPHMKRQRQGHIVNVASVGGLRGIPNISIYSASKAALITLSDALRVELRDYGIHITVLCTGRISGTAFFERAVAYGPVQLYETLKPLTPETVANALLAAIAGRKPLVILPWQARVLHLVNKLAPCLMDWFLYRHRPKLETTETEPRP